MPRYRVRSGRMTRTVEAESMLAAARAALRAEVDSPRPRRLGDLTSIEVCEPLYTDTEALLRELGVEVRPVAEGEVDPDA